ncbi:LPS-assembly protein LptD [Qingshengfaniella alkalisoli]|uniref:LPS-assembly protein LptD n=1 Tax=Qingshengfaniella alkalisoli TaxID=2599296 RepID=A0A5B8IW20_9RHOB|nr:LPS assembly protein LptD [Qingshengfaniella alkalisoli]QDY68708.1 LPS-assembly protein LptD [Qingshengfaniella alkalisoli]
MKTSLRHIKPFLSILIAVLALVSTASAQVADEEFPTSIMADVMRVEGDDRLIAEGDVTVFSGGRSISASRIAYDRDSGRIDVEGPIILRDGSDAVVLADTAELSTDLTDGIARGARLILDQHLQVAGAELARTEGRFTDLKRVVASSCSVCSTSETPLWEIRARRVIHDEERKRLYFYDAQFRVAGLPIAYSPYMRFPDPTNTRLSGVLAPSVRTTDDLGWGLKLPFFLTLGDHADITFTPYFSTDYTRTLEMRYRQAFRTGEIEFEGAVSRDSIEDGQLRTYLFGSGSFDLPRDYDLRFSLETARDDQYLQDYDYSSADRLQSNLSLLRTREHERVDAEINHFRSLRENEDNDTLPTFITDFRIDRRMNPTSVGGWLDLSLIGHSHQRPSSVDVAGRDMAQIRAVGKWTRDWTTPTGLRYGADLIAHGDFKYIGQDSNYPEYQTGITPIMAAEVSYPLAKWTATGVSYQLEPVAQLAYTRTDPIDSPNDDSRLTSFDTGNLFALNRFPGLDRYEEGTRATLAMTWRRIDPNGWSLGVTAGKVYRFAKPEQFPLATGLSGSESDWLLQADLDLGDNMKVRSLSLIDSAMEFTLNETTVSWRSDSLRLASSYLWQRADTALDLTTDLNELALEADYDITDRWNIWTDLRRDFQAARTNRAEFGLSYTNECVRVDLSMLQRFRNTEETEPTTSYGLSVTLAGFGDDDRRVSRRTCSARG